MSEEVKEPVVASLGKAERVQINVPAFNETPDNTDVPHGTLPIETDTPELTADQKAANIAAGKNEDGTDKTTDDGTGTRNEPPPATTQPLTDEELKAEYEKRFPTQAALTDEDKQKQADAFEKRMLDLYVEGGGKIEEFAFLKQIAATDLTDLVPAQLTKELKAMGITNPEHIALIQKERLEQLSEEELEQYEDETEKDFAKRKREYDKSQIEGRASQEKENAVDFFNNLKEAVNQKDFFTKRENEVSANVDEHFSKLEKKMTLQLGQVDNTDIAPVEYEVPQEVIDKARARLNTPASRKQLLFNSDGSINHTNLADLVLKAEMFESGTAAKTAYLTGATREVEKFEKLFPYRSAAALGTGGNQQNSGNTGKVVSAGKVQQVQRRAVGQ